MIKLMVNTGAGGRDNASVMNLNGRRNNQIIINSVKNKENFSRTLRCIKFWAKRNQLSSNTICFLGGISWAILVAKICCLFPNYPVNLLLEQFFKIYSE
jgi:poly(A) polymerase